MSIKNEILPIKKPIPMVLRLGNEKKTKVQFEVFKSKLRKLIENKIERRNRNGNNQIYIEGNKEKKSIIEEFYESKILHKASHLT